MIGSLNIGGNSTSFGGIDRYLSGQQGRVDVVVVQEVRVQEQALQDLVRGWGYKVRVSLDPVSGLGVGVIWREDLQLSRVWVVEEGRILFLDLGGLVLFNVYGPSGKSRAQVRRGFYGQTLFRALSSCRGRNCVVLGDFNCVLQELDASANWKDRHCPVLGDLVAAFRLVDGFRFLYPGRREYTWIREGFSKSRLDRVYLWEGGLDSVVGVEHEVSQSDHKALVVTLRVGEEFGAVPRAGGASPFWKLNASCLVEEDCREQLGELLAGLQPLKSRYVDVADWWDQCVKGEVRAFLMKYGRRRARERRDTVAFLYALLEVVTKEGEYAEMARVKMALKEFSEQDAWGVAVRAGAGGAMAVEEEGASIFHLNNEVKIGEKVAMDSLKVGDEVVEDPAIIEEQLVGFFKPLFEGRHRSGGVVAEETFVQDPQHLPEFLDILPRLSVESRRKLEREVTWEELVEVVGECPRGKSSGTDGLTYEFYQNAGEDYLRELLLVFREILRRFRLTVSMETGAIRLIPKVEGVPSVDQLRPITLLQCDYKILTKILTRRLVTVLDEVLLSGQMIGKPRGGGHDCVWGLQPCPGHPLCPAGQAWLGDFLGGLDESV